MKVAIIGAGYVGLVTGVGLASLGHEIVCVEKDVTKINEINAGYAHFYETHLNDMLAKVIKDGNFKATSEISDALFNADISMIAVGTPFSEGEIDLSYIRQAAMDIGVNAHLASKNHVVCVKSTVVPGTTINVVKPIVEEYSQNREGIYFGMNPEFLAEGTAVHDFMNPDRVVIGADNSIASQLLTDLYAPFAGVDIKIVSIETAEIAKYASNSFFATLISFSNEISNLCSSVEGVDVLDVMNAVHLDKRISPIIDGQRITPGLVSFLHPGVGYGGSCFPKDVKSIIQFGQERGHALRLLEKVDEINVKQTSEFISLIKKNIASLKNVKVGILGLSFKPGTDDIRESPAIKIIHELTLEGANIHAHDPMANHAMHQILSPKYFVKYHESVDSLLHQVDLVLLLTSWPEYKKIGILDVCKNMPIFDGRRFLNKYDYPLYHGLGLNNQHGKKYEM